MASIIADWVPKISAQVAADTEGATRQHVEFDKHAQHALGMNNPALGPLAALLLRTESASSCQIEQLMTSAKQIAPAEIGERKKALAVLGVSTSGK